MSFTSRPEAEAGHRLASTADSRDLDPGGHSCDASRHFRCLPRTLPPFLLSKRVPVGPLPKSSRVIQFWTPGCWQHSVQGVGSWEQPFLCSLVPSSSSDWTGDKRLDTRAAILDHEGRASAGDSRSAGSKKTSGPSRLCRHV